QIPRWGKRNHRAIRAPECFLLPNTAMPPILSRKLSRNDRSVDVLVVVASPVGLCHALWLAQQNLHVAVIDSRAPGGIRDEWLLLEPEALALLDSLQILAKL